MVPLQSWQICPSNVSKKERAPEFNVIVYVNYYHNRMYCNFVAKDIF